MLRIQKVSQHHLRIKTKWEMQEKGWEHRSSSSVVFVQTHAGEQAVLPIGRGQLRNLFRWRLIWVQRPANKMQIRGIRKVSAADCTRCQRAFLSLWGNPVLGLGSQFHRKRLWERIPAAVRAPATAPRLAVLKMATGHQRSGRTAVGQIRAVAPSASCAWPVWKPR